MKIVRSALVATSPVALALFAAAPARAQDLILPPDFSQLRTGLPRTSAGTAGGAYCGPTSAADCLQWMHDNGFPEVESMGVDTDAVTISIFLLGALMGTDADGGTTPEDMVDGLQSYLDAVRPGDFVAGYVGRDCAGAVAQALGHSFGTMVLLLEEGRLPIARVGWYELPGGNRCSGHYVAMTGYTWLGGSSWEARYRDPAREIDTISTKDTTFELLALEDGDGVIRDQWASSWNWAREGSTSSGCNNVARTGVQDGIVYIGGMRLFSPALTGGVIVAYNRASGQHTSYAMAGSSTATSLAPHPYLADLYHCNPNDNQIYKTDIRSGQVTVHSVGSSLNQPRRLAFAADATLLVLQGSSSSGFDLLAFRSDGSLIQMVTRPTMGAIVYHDATDRVYWWTGPSNQLLLYEPDLDPAGTALQLPAGPAFAAPGYLAADPRRDIVYYNHQGSSAIYRFDVFRQIPLAPIVASQLVDPADMMCDNRGHLYVVQASNGPVLEFDEDGQLVSGSPAGSLSAANVLGIARSPRRPIPVLSAFGGTDTDIPVPLPFPDCNRNGVPDDQDIANGTSRDDFPPFGIPDECLTSKVRRTDEVPRSL